MRATEKLWLVFGTHAADHEDRAFAWVTQNHDQLAQGIPPFARAFLPFIGAGCSAERWRKTEAFFAAPARQVPGVQQQLAEVGDEVAGCLRLREREGAAVERWLAAAAARAE